MPPILTQELPSHISCLARRHCDKDSQWQEWKPVTKPKYICVYIWYIYIIYFNLKYKQPSFKYYANIRQNFIQNIPKHTHTQSLNKFKFSATVTEQSDKVSPIIDTKSKSKPKRKPSNSKVTRSSSYHSKSFPSSTELAYVITNRRLV